MNSFFFFFFELSAPVFALKVYSSAPKISVDGVNSDHYGENDNLEDHGDHDDDDHDHDHADCADASLDSWSVDAEIE